MAGSTLIEVIIASMLLMMMTVPIMSAALGGRSMTVKTNHRLQAAAGARQVAEALKSYVVADVTLANGPGVGTGGWQLPGDSTGLNALAQGHHVLSASQYLPNLAAAPNNGAISYDVTIRLTPQGPQPDVSVSVTWDEL